MRHFVKHGLPVFATRDWHPADHCSFRAAGGPWPPHCISGTAGAQFPPDLALPANVQIVSKATAREPDSYSGFAGTNLAHQLEQARVRRVFVGGLATDYCVLNTVKDALALGFAIQQDCKAGEPLLQPVMAGGERTGPHPPLAAIRDHVRCLSSKLPPALLQLEAAPAYPVTVSQSLQELARIADQGTKGL
jgi:hypothetical protein